MMALDMGHLRSPAAPNQSSKMFTQKKTWFISFLDLVMKSTYIYSNQLTHSIADLSQ